MKTKFSGILTLMLALFVQISFAQEKQISGNVSDNDGLPLPGATVVVQGTSNGVSTDFDGNFTILANTTDKLEISYVGYATKTVEVGNLTTFTIQLEKGESLDEVLVTAQGIKREKKALGYAITKIDAEDLESKPETDISRILTGKVAGVEVNAGGGFLGTSANVIIRSKNSISGNNQPLYVVDGAPISGGRSYDLDANNIASLTVLKGLAASTLYGQDGRNGVIVIATKTGSQSKGSDEKFEISVSSTTSMLEVANLPEFQNSYGQGADNAINTTYFGTWGAAFNGQTVPHHLSIGAYADSFPQFQGETVEYKAAKNNVNDFFSAGIGQTTSVIVSKSLENNSGVSFGFGHTDQTGYISENGLKRYNLNFGGRTDLANNFSLNTSVSYNKTATKRPTRDFFTLLTWIPRNLDIHNLPFEDPNDSSSVYYRTTYTNPRWQQKNTGFTEDTDRIFMKAGLDYKLNDKVRLSYLYSLDNYSENNANYSNKGAADDPLGFMQSFDNNQRTTNHRVGITGNDFKLSEKITLNAVLGAESKNVKSEFIGLLSEDQVVFGYLNHNNFRDHSPYDGGAEVNTVGAYGQLAFDYDNYLFVTLSGRNDWGSTTTTENNSIFYPSASVSFIPTSFFENLKGSAVNYLKLRASYGTSANFPSAYLTSPVLSANANAFINPFNSGLVSTNALSTFLPNPNIKPELLKEFEFGTEGRLFDNLIDFDISVYKRIVEDQILSSSLAASTGYSSTVINAGRIDTDGLEISLGINPIRNAGKGFNWNMNTQFTAYETTVIDIPVERIDISSGVNYAIEGEPYGVFRGTFAAKDDQGNLLINAETGKIISSEDLGLEDKIIGDPNEDWRITNINTFSYKNFTLGVQWEYIHGGDIYSVSASNLLRRGVTRDTEDREGSYVIPGVLANASTGEPIVDGNGDLIKNNIQLAANDLYFINLMDVDENIVYDASVFRLRDVSLTYSLPSEFLDKTPIGSLSVTLSGNNLWYKAPNLPKYMNLDPEVLGSGTGNGKGLDFQNDPSYKQYSIGVKLTF
jgi:TonB-linked SusC/RagA family outer membrane protein